MNRMMQKAQYLRMTLSSARTRLRDMLLFTYVKDANDNVCEYCKRKILKADDFALVHKEEWFLVSRDLFWDRDNVAFAHRSCAKALHYAKLSAPESKTHSWCSKCKRLKVKKHFGRNVGIKDNRRKWCRTCVSKYERERRTGESSNDLQDMGESQE